MPRWPIRKGQVQAEAEDYCSGRIRFEPAGAGGFGYDPLFEIVEYHRTFGELGPAVKAALSHRARAIRQLLPMIQRLVEYRCMAARRERSKK